MPDKSDPNPIDLVALAEAALANASAGYNDQAPVAELEAAVTKFDEEHPYAAAGKRWAKIEALAAEQQQRRHASVTLAAQLASEAAGPIRAAVERASDVQEDDLEPPKGYLASFDTILQMKLVREMRERGLHDDLRRMNVSQVAELYDQAVSAGPAHVVKFLEAEVARGLPDVSSRKGDVTKNQLVFNALRQRVAEQRAARVPAPLRQAAETLERVRRQARQWQAVSDRLQGPQDLERLLLRVKDLRARRAKEAEAAESGQ